MPWLIVPAVLLFSLFFVLPFGVLGVMSFLSGSPVNAPSVHLTLRHYERFLADDLYLEALWATLRIGLITTLAALLIGYPLAHLMARARSRIGHAVLLMAVIAPMLTGIVVSDKIVGVSIFTSAIGLGFRTDKGLTPPTSWNDLAAASLAGQRGGYLIPVNSLGQAHLMMLGKIHGKGFEDLDAAYKALEALKPIKLFDFTGQMEKALLSGEVTMGVIHDSGIFRYDGQNQPIEFAAPKEGVLALEQVLNVTPGSKVKELAFAYIDYMLRPDVQKELAEGVWYSPSNRKVKLDAKYDAKLFNSEAKVAQLQQVPWQWYNAKKDEIDARVQRLLKG